MKACSAFQERCTHPRLGNPTNEAYLFHGSNPTSAISILSTSFKVDFAGAAVGTMFGPGVYLAESSAKSDEYRETKIRVVPMTASSQCCFAGSLLEARTLWRSLETTQKSVRLVSSTALSGIVKKQSVRFESLLSSTKPPSIQSTWLSTAESTKMDLLQQKRRRRHLPRMHLHSTQCLVKRGRCRCKSRRVWSLEPGFSARRLGATRWRL